MVEAICSELTVKAVSIPEFKYGARKRLGAVYGIILVQCQEFLYSYGRGLRGLGWRKAVRCQKRETGTLIWRERLSIGPGFMDGLVDTVQYKICTICGASLSMIQYK